MVGVCSGFHTREARGLGAHVAPDPVDVMRDARRHEGRVELGARRVQVEGDDAGLQHRESERDVQIIGIKVPLAQRTQRVLRRWFDPE